ncbi:Spy/CpxP family protein refolding chaperone [Sulfurospirillum sp.]|nr:Spy/CpxP family protein refolding chaperone [Sulfurospirillum sp.]
MTKKILVTAVLVGSLATGAFASNKDCQYHGQMSMKHQQEMQQTKKRGWHGYKMRQKGMQHNDNQNMRQMFYKIKLTDDQQFKLSILRDEMKLEMKKLRGNKRQGKMLDFISEDGFDKDAFIKEADKNHEKMIDIKASHMEKVFKILTKEQIAKLKKNLNS